MSNQHFFNGSPIDPKFIIERFRDLLKLLPKTKLPVPPNKPKLPPPKRPTIKIPKDETLPIKTEGVGKKKYTKKKASKPPSALTELSQTIPHRPLEKPKTLKGEGGDNYTKDDLYSDMINMGFQHGEAQEFITKLYKAGKRVPRPKKEDQRPVSIIKKFKEIMGYEEPLGKEEKEYVPVDEKETELKKRDEKLEKEASNTFNLIRNKAARLAAILKQKYNFKTTTKLPAGLEYDFMNVYPDDEEKIIAQYENELSAIKVKNDESDAQGKVKKDIDSDELSEKMLKLANKRVKLKKQLESISEGLVAGPEVITKIKANPKRKVKITGPGRGKKSKGGKKTTNIETIKLVI